MAPGGSSPSPTFDSESVLDQYLSHNRVSSLAFVASVVEHRLGWDTYFSREDSPNDTGAVAVVDGSMYLSSARSEDQSDHTSIQPRYS